MTQRFVAMYDVVARFVARACGAYLIEQFQVSGKAQFQCKRRYNPEKEAVERLQIQPVHILQEQL